MKKILLMILSIAIAYSVYAQENYKLVVLPLMSPTIGDEPNPYMVSSALESALRDKGVNTTYKNDDSSVAPCEILFAKINKMNSMLRCKVNIELTDCTNRIVWSGEGVGVSKDYQAGYGEAVIDALKDFESLPSMQDYALTQQVVRTTPESVSAVIPASKIKPANQASDIDAYQSETLCFGDSYIFDMRDTGDGNKELVIMNGESKGYNKLEVVAKLKVADVPGIYNVEFNMPDGTVCTGVATERNTSLDLSISCNGNNEKINLQKQ